MLKAEGQVYILYRHGCCTGSLLPWLLHITIAFNFVGVSVYVVVCGHKM